MVVLSPYVRVHARTSMSELALVEEYGELGRYGVSSVNLAGPSRARSP